MPSPHVAHAPTAGATRNQKPDNRNPALCRPMPWRPCPWGTTQWHFASHTLLSPKPPLSVRMPPPPTCTAWPLSTAYNNIVPPRAVSRLPWWHHSLMHCLMCSDVYASPLCLGRHHLPFVLARIKNPLSAMNPSPPVAPSSLPPS